MKYQETSNGDLRIRFAEEVDTPLILELIGDLAQYEHMTHKLEVTEELLRENLFVKKLAQVLIAEYKGKSIGYALYFYTFSTFRGKANLYLEDLFLRPESRGVGAGRALLSCLASIAMEKGCGKMEWMCLNWNEPSIRFYEKMGAHPADGWTVFRLEGDALAALAAQF